MKLKPRYAYLPTGFISGDYEVRLLQDDRVTVCVIRHLKKLDERYMGVTVRNVKDVFSAIDGRHKAFKKVLSKGEYAAVEDPRRFLSQNRHEFNIMITVKVNHVPIRQLQRDYWKRYAEEEK